MSGYETIGYDTQHATPAAVDKADKEHGYRAEVCGWTFISFRIPHHPSAAQSHEPTQNPYVYPHHIINHISTVK